MAKKGSPLSGEMRIKDRTAWAQHLDEIISSGASSMMSTTDDASRLRAVRMLMTHLKPLVNWDDPASREFLKQIGFTGKPKEFDPSKLSWSQLDDMEEAIWRRWQACQDLIVRKGLGPTNQFRERVGAGRR